MKNTLRLAIIGGLVAVGIAQSQAQTTNTNVITFTTNMEQILNVTLTGFVGGASNAAGVSTVRIGNKDLISSMATATGVAFSPRAKLILINGLSTDTNAPTAIVVRDTLSRTNVDTDVSSFFSIGTIGTPVIKSKTNAQGKTSGTEWSINSFTFGSTGADTNGPSATTLFFDLQGFTTTALSSGAFNSSVNGPATVNLLDAVLQGKITAAAGKVKKLPVQ